MRKHLSKMTVSLICLGLALSAMAAPPGKNKLSYSNAKIAARSGPEKLWVGPATLTLAPNRLARFNGLPAIRWFNI
jgi:hypothetical protein